MTLPGFYRDNLEFREVTEADKEESAKKYANNWNINTTDKDSEERAVVEEVEKR